jgi:hypothetical protein
VHNHGAAIAPSQNPFQSHPLPHRLHEQHNNKQINKQMGNAVVHLEPNEQAVVRRFGRSKRSIVNGPGFLSAPFSRYVQRCALLCISSALGVDRGAARGKVEFAGSPSNPTQQLNCRPAFSTPPDWCISTTNIAFNCNHSTPTQHLSKHHHSPHLRLRSRKLHATETVVHCSATTRKFNCGQRISNFRLYILISSAASNCCSRSAPTRQLSRPQHSLHCDCARPEKTRRQNGRATPTSTTQLWHHRLQLKHSLNTNHLPAYSMKIEQATTLTPDDCINTTTQLWRHHLQLFQHTFNTNHLAA